MENQWQTFYLNISELADGVNFDHIFIFIGRGDGEPGVCLLYTSPSPRDYAASRMPSSA